MTRTLFALATAIFTLTLTVKAEDYYHGQNGYYAPEYYSPPPSTPPPPREETAPPPPTYVPAPQSQSTVTIYNNAPSAQPEEGAFSWWQPTPYFRADIGPAFFQNSRMEQYGVPANDSIKYKIGGTINAAAGYTINPYLAADLEAGFWSARVDHINFFTFDRADLYEIPIMVNLTADLPLQNDNIIPYVGGGMGGSVAIFDTQNFTTPANPTINGSEADMVFAGQLFAGVRFRINPKMWIGAEYRFFCTTQPHWNYPGGFRMSIGGLEADAIMFTFAWRF